MGSEASIATTLKNAGHRATLQRVLILSVIRHAGGHLTLSQIKDQVRRSYPTIDISTVYRNLSTLKDLRLISETKVGGLESQYEWVSKEKHLHIVCRRCSEAVQIEDSYLGPLGESLLNDYGYTLDIDHFTISGICSVCMSDSEKRDLN